MTRPPRYQGPLSPRQAAEGIAAARANAKALLEDAETLLQRESWPRAFGLAVLAIEEAGKTRIIRELVLARDEKECRTAWREYRTHSKKTLLTILPELAARGARRFDELARPMFDPTSNHGPELEADKQSAFYTDVLSDGTWTLPERAISESDARKVVLTARLLAGKKSEAMSSEAELTLWVKHLRPIRGETDQVRLRQAVVACYAEAEAMGVLQGSGPTEGLREFLGI